MHPPDLVVIGAGVVGASCALAAARRGLRTLLLERFEIGHQHGSSHGESRIIRQAYGTTHHIELARAAYRHWRTVQREVGVRLLRRTGGLDFGPPDVPSLAATADAMTAAGVRHTRLSRAELAARFPQLRFEPGTEGLYQPDGGVLAAASCVRALAAVAAQHGCEIQERALARSIRPAGDGVLLNVNGRRVRAGAAIVAAGSWVNQVLAGTGTELPVTVTREQVAWFRVDPVAFHPDRFPVMIEHRPRRPYLISMFPELNPRGGSKLMLDRNGPPVPPEDLTGTVDQRALAELAGYARRRLPGVGPVLRTETCRYTMTPDAEFVLDVLPGHPQIGVASPCSGHGFKFGPVFGEIMVDLVTTGSSRHPVGPFRLDRFLPHAA
jgi:monomeric sarcosine oxidase